MKISFLILLCKSSTKTSQANWLITTALSAWVFASFLMLFYVGPPCLAALFLIHLYQNTQWFILQVFICLNESSILFPPFPLRSSFFISCILSINPWLVWDMIRVLPQKSPGALQSLNHRVTQVLFKVLIVSWNEEQTNYSWTIFRKSSCPNKIHLAKRDTNSDLAEAEPVPYH